jgi:hypothetical protein
VKLPASSEAVSVFDASIALPRFCFAMGSTAAAASVASSGESGDAKEVCGDDRPLCDIGKARGEAHARAGGGAREGDSEARRQRDEGADVPPPNSRRLDRRIQMSHSMQYAGTECAVHRSEMRYSSNAE